MTSAAEAVQSVIVSDLERRVAKAIASEYWMSWFTASSKRIAVLHQSV
jgi:hypothetical protein